MLQIKVKKGSKKGSKFGNSLSELIEPKFCQNSLQTVLRNRHIVHALDISSLNISREKVWQQNLDSRNLEKIFW